MVFYGNDGVTTGVDTSRHEHTLFFFARVGIQAAHFLNIRYTPEYNPCQAAIGCPVNQSSGSRRTGRRESSSTSTSFQIPNTNSETGTTSSDSPVYHVQRRSILQRLLRAFIDWISKPLSVRSTYPIEYGLVEASSFNHTFYIGCSQKRNENLMTCPAEGVGLQIKQNGRTERYGIFYLARNNANQKTRGKRRYLLCCTHEVGCMCSRFSNSCPSKCKRIRDPWLSWHELCMVF